MTNMEYKRNYQKLAGQHSWFEKEGTKCLKNHSNGTSRDLKDICKVATQATNGLQAKLKLVEDERTREAGWTQDLLVLEKARKNFPGVVPPAKLVRADCVQQDLHSLPHACRECAETTEWVRGNMCPKTTHCGRLGREEDCQQQPKWRRESTRNPRSLNRDQARPQRQYASFS